MINWKSAPGTYTPRRTAGAAGKAAAIRISTAGPEPLDHELQPAADLVMVIYRHCTAVLPVSSNVGFES